MRGNLQFHLSVYTTYEYGIIIDFSVESTPLMSFKKVQCQLDLIKITAASKKRLSGQGATMQLL